MDELASGNLCPLSQILIFFSRSNDRSDTISIRVRDVYYVGMIAFFDGIFNACVVPQGTAHIIEGETDDEC
jgi:hypothetical protein